MTTRAQARDDINGALKAAVDAYNLANPSKQVAVLYDDLADQPPDGKSAWIRATVKHNASDLRSMGGVGRRKFTRMGVVLVQVFVPSGDGFTRADALAKTVADAYEGRSTPNGVWYRKVVAKEIGKSGDWSQTNVTAEFSYDETL